MGDTLLEFFVGAFQAVLNPIKIEQVSIRKLIEQQGKLFMAAIDKVQELSAQLDAVVAAIGTERSEVANALTTLTDEIAALKAQIADLLTQVGSDETVSAALDAQIAKVGEALSAVKAIYEVPVVEEPPVEEPAA